MSQAWIKPISGWGYQETVDGELPEPFDINVIEEGVRTAGGNIGWRGVALNGKYDGNSIQMAPRHLEWTGVVVMRVGSDDRDWLFYGMADTRGLECNWK